MFYRLGIRSLIADWQLTRGNFAFMKAEMSWKLTSAENIESVRFARLNEIQTITSKNDTLVLIVSKECHQLRWVFPNEFWRFQGIDPCELFPSWDHTTQHLKVDDHIRFAGQAFHMLSMGAFLIAALPMKRLRRP